MDDQSSNQNSSQPSQTTTTDKLSVKDQLIKYKFEIGGLVLLLLALMLYLNKDKLNLKNMGSTPKIDRTFSPQE